MKTENVRANLGRTVIFDNSKYMLSAMICRRKRNEYYYQVELQDKCNRSIVITSPDKIELESGINESNINEHTP